MKIFSLLIFFSASLLQAGYVIDETNSVNVCHWKKIEKEICKRGDFIDWFSGQKTKKVETIRSLGPRFYCEEGSYYLMARSGTSWGQQGSLLDSWTGGGRIYCVYNGTPWINVKERK